MYDKKSTIIHINPTGRYVNHSSLHDSGLTGRKLIVDSFGGYAPIGGGAQSSKDYTKVDRSGLYAARWISKNILVASGLAKKNSSNILCNWSCTTNFCFCWYNGFIYKIWWW